MPEKKSCFGCIDLALYRTICHLDGKTHSERCPKFRQTDYIQHYGKDKANKLAAWKAKVEG